ncbi:hypothetical protein LCGC14_1375790 [marine sediment metagenome]|uniref:Uncharacterized protein n=1 Tax=marine sediment metagenome TaxID=412755 RepID=A0A0F9MJD4_9ZZZZ
MTEEPTKVSIDPGLLKAFAEHLKDPENVAKLRRQASFAEFKEKYGVTHASPLKCPVCSQGGYAGGTLWTGPDQKHFICRRCLTEIEIQFTKISNEEMIMKLREASK